MRPKMPLIKSFPYLSRKRVERGEQKLTGVNSE
jgi:hypothetical protein